jgi:hypothetical protein
MTRAILALLCALPFAATAATDDTGLTMDEWRAMLCAPDGTDVMDRVTVPPLTPAGNPLAAPGLWSGGWIDVTAPPVRARDLFQRPGQPAPARPATPEPAPPQIGLPAALWMILTSLALLVLARFAIRRTR